MAATLSPIPAQPVSAAPAPASCAALDDFVYEIDTHGDHETGARQLEAWARHADSAGEVSQAELLCAAGEQWILAGEHAHGLQLLEEVAASGTRTRIDARALMARAYIDLDRPDEARQQLAALRPGKTQVPLALLYTGSLFETLGDLTAAHRWYTRGVLLAEQAPPADEVSVAGLYSLLTARLRVRRALGCDIDTYDELAVAALQMRLAGQEAASAPTAATRRGTCPCGSGRKERKCCGRNSAVGGPAYAISREGDTTVIDLF